MLSVLALQLSAGADRVGMMCVVCHQARCSFTVWGGKPGVSHQNLLALMQDIKTGLQQDATYLKQALNARDRVWHRWYDSQLHADGSLEE